MRNEPDTSRLIADLFQLADSMDVDRYPGADIVRDAARLLTCADDCVHAPLCAKWEP